MELHDVIIFREEGALVRAHGVIEQISEEEAQIHFINMRGETTAQQRIALDQLQLSTSPVWSGARDLWVEKRLGFENRVDGYLVDVATIIKEIAEKRDVSEETVSHIINDWHKWQHTNPSPEI